MSHINERIRRGKDTFMDNIVKIVSEWIYKIEIASFDS